MCIKCELQKVLKDNGIDVDINQMTIIPLNGQSTDVQHVHLDLNHTPMTGDKEELKRQAIGERVGIAFNNIQDGFDIDEALFTQQIFEAAVNIIENDSRGEDKVLLMIERLHKITTELNRAYSEATFKGNNQIN